MQTKILIKTPKGHARAMQKKLKPFILGRTMAIGYVNDDDNELIWEVEGPVKDIIRINRNVALFDTLVQQTFSSKIFQKKVQKLLSPEDQIQLQDMLMQHTSVEIIKNASAEEIVEFNKTWWQKIKEKWTKLS